ncbi:hypothetical protein [Pseudarthrobacter sulfonivorans]|uniref:hypothetical protein n=1 Tax=Pseudarthrobacter sulfonivorans TaxID=121292 RepID=UPI0012FE60A6|nr:hypothetical protein [Pseudarthrobacter sulfonivorans]
MEDPERRELALSRDDVEHAIDPKAADEFVLQVGVTDVEPKLGQRTGPDARPASARAMPRDSPASHKPSNRWPAPSGP